jgi:hypothetical protein
MSSLGKASCQENLKKIAEHSIRCTKKIHLNIAFFLLRHFAAEENHKIKNAIAKTSF